MNAKPRFLSKSSPKFLVVGLDGFRPEMMSPELTPNLWALAQGGVRFTNHRCCFPSETFVNLPSLVSGAPPAGHGIPANTFFAPELDLPGRAGEASAFYGGAAEHVDLLANTSGGHPFTTPTLADILGAAGRTMAVFGTCEPGGARLKHPTAAHWPGHISFATDAPEVNTPHHLSAEIIAELGPPPKLDWSVPYDDDTRLHHTYLTDAFLSYVARRGLPDVSLLWYTDPDHAFHAFGIGSEEARLGIADADAGFGRIMKALDGHPDRERLNVLAVSDHAHITLGERLDTLEIFRQAGLKPSATPDADADIWVRPNYCGNVFAPPAPREDQTRVLKRAARALMEHPDIGMVLSKNGEDEIKGALPLTALKTEHPRGPHLMYICRTSDEPDEHGFVGMCRHDAATMTAGQSSHGGLHPKELHNLLVAGGPAFADGASGGAASAIHSGIADITPTVLNVMGLEHTGARHGGRVLSEAFRKGAGAGAGAGAPPPEETPKEISETLTAEWGGFAQELRLTRIGEQVYPDGGRRLD
ncbi:MAG: alkaline phosphatase family protein [Rhodospirillales bacterium]